MLIAVGTDHRGFPIRTKIIELLERLGHEVDDEGTFTNESVDYPDIAALVAEKISRGEVDRGILVCGTGLGMCIAANKVRGIRAAHCYNAFTARRARQHNDANILCMGGRITTPTVAIAIVEAFLKAEFERGRHARRVEKITAIEKSDKG